MASKPDLNDTVGLAGFVLLVVGVACWSFGAALVVAGVVLLGTAVVGELRRKV